MNYIQNRPAIIVQTVSLSYQCRIFYILYLNTYNIGFGKYRHYIAIYGISNIRSQHYSFSRLFVPMMELSFSRPFVPGNKCYMEHSFAERFGTWKLLIFKLLSKTANYVFTKH